MLIYVDIIFQYLVVKLKPLSRLCPHGDVPRHGSGWSKQNISYEVPGKGGGYNVYIHVHTYICMCVYICVYTMLHSSISY